MTAKAQTGKKPSQKTKEVVALEDYMAMVRYQDGSRDVFCIKNAKNLDDARAMVQSETMNIQTLLIKLRKTGN